MDSSRSKPSFTSLVAFGILLLPFAWILSYAPVVRLTGLSPLSDELSNCYGPVDWMLDLTPLYEPYLKWAALWDVEEEFDADELVLRAYQVEWVDCGEISKTLTSMIPKVVINEEGRNQDVFIYATPREHRHVRALIKSLDVPAETPGSN